MKRNIFFKVVVLFLVFAFGLLNVNAYDGLAASADIHITAVVMNPGLPQTIDDYDGLWHAADFYITLTVIGAPNDVSDTFYKINDGAAESVSVDGQPFITMEGDKNTLEYWSVDRFGREESPHNLLAGIKLDKALPSVSILTPADKSIFDEAAITIEGIVDDAPSGIDKFEIDVGGTIYTPQVEPDGSFTLTDVAIILGPNEISALAQDRAGNYSGQSITVYLNAQIRPYQDGWPVRLPPPLLNPINVADLDDDGTTEVILNSGSIIYIWQYNGDDFPGWPQTIDEDIYSVFLAYPLIRDVAIASSVCLGDLNGDGEEEIILVNDSAKNKIYAWTHDGHELQGWPINLGDEEVDFTDGVAVGDLDRDGHNEVVACSKSADGGIYVFRNDGTIMRHWPRTSHHKHKAPRDVGYSKGAPILGNLDHKGGLEIVFSSNISPSDCKIYVLRHRDPHSHHDVLVHGWPVELDANFDFPPIMGDLDRDGKIEVIAATKGNRVYAFDNKGNLLSGWPVETNETITFSPIIGDIDSDGYPDILVCTEKRLFAWHGDGTTVNGWPITTTECQDGSLGSPVLCDLDGDGDIELLAYSSVGEVYAWDLNGAYDEDYIEWGKYRYDEKHSGLYRSKFVLYIEEIHPSTGRPGRRISINGRNFGRRDPSCRVHFDGEGGSANAEIKHWRDRSIRCRVPDLPDGEYKVIVINSTGQSNIKNFSIKKKSKKRGGSLGISI